MLEAPSSALNGRHETQIYAQDVALAVAVARKVTGLQRQIILELHTPSPDRKPSESAMEQDGRLTKEERDQKEPTPTQDTVRADAPSTAGRLDILV